MQPLLKMRDLEGGTPEPTAMKEEKHLISFFIPRSAVEAKVQDFKKKS